MVIVMEEFRFSKRLNIHKHIYICTHTFFFYIFPIIKVRRVDKKSAYAFTVHVPATPQTLFSFLFPSFVNVMILFMNKSFLTLFLLLLHLFRIRWIFERLRPIRLNWNVDLVDSFFDVYCIYTWIIQSGTGKKAFSKRENFVQDKKTWNVRV